MHFKTIKTASLGAIAVALGTSTLGDAANARPVGIGAEWNNGWGRSYNAAPSGWNWQEPVVGRKRKAARHQHVSRKHASRGARAAMQTGAQVLDARPVDHRFPDARSTYALQVEQGSRRSRRVTTDHPPVGQMATTGFGGGALVSEARRYLGGNPTGRSSLWCGAFMDLILQRTGHRPGSNLARDYANYGTRISGPQIGAIAVMSRGKRGGHVGVVSGIDESGNPIVISGNHGRRVAESTYSRGRVLAYVMP